ncbi:MAG: hypothetical protein HYW12_01385 [Planctomycetes bacterium]|nr:hypothetical protein [Planctomycetota bacterium]
MSKEVGAPLINDFLDELLDNVSKSQSKRLRTFLINYGKKGNIEKILSEIDSHVMRGKNLAGYDLSSLRKIRIEIVNGILITLDKAQYDFLSKHYEYKRYEDPFYYEKRDFKAIKRTKGKFPPKSHVYERELARKRALLREARELGKIRHDYLSSIREHVSEDVDPAVVFYLVCAALSGGAERFREWLLHLWPLRSYSGHYELNIKPRGWSEDLKNECIAQFLNVLDESAVENSGAKAYIEELRELLNGWKLNRKIRQCDVDDIASEIAEHIYPVLFKNSEWLKKQAYYLLKGFQNNINPYPLLAAFVKQTDTVITFNYDLFIETSISFFLDYIWKGIDYGIPDLIGITPWGEHGKPFGDYYLTTGHKSLLLLKLHGSINWLRCPFCYKMYCTFYTPATTSAVNNVFRDLIKFEWETYQSYPCCDLFKLSNVQIPIIPPTLKKSMEVGSIAEIWRKARYEIAIASELIFIGSAFSPSDRYFRYLIEDAINLRYSGKADYYALQKKVRYSGKLEYQRYVDPSKTPLTVKVINPSSTVQERYKKIFSSLKIKPQVIECTASEYLKKEYLATSPEVLFKHHKWQ